MKPMRIYVAGPVTSKDPEVVKENIEKARKVGEELLKLGHFPYVPHTHFSSWDIDIHDLYQNLFEHGMTFITQWADAFFFIASSNGANAERAEAEKLGIPIFEDLSQIGKVDE